MNIRYFTCFYLFFFKLTTRKLKVEIASQPYKSMYSLTVCILDTNFGLDFTLFLC